MSTAELEANVSLFYGILAGWVLSEAPKGPTGRDSLRPLPRDPLSSIGFLSHDYDIRQIQLWWLVVPQYSVLSLKDINGQGLLH